MCIFQHSVNFHPKANPKALPLPATFGNRHKPHPSSSQAPFGPFGKYSTAIMKEKSKQFRNRIHNETPSSPPPTLHHDSGDETEPTRQVHTPTLVTPSKLNLEDERHPKNKRIHGASRRQLSFHQREDSENLEQELATSSVTDVSYFGGRTSSTSDSCQANTRRVYTLVNKMTGSIGGNGKSYFL